MSLVMGREPLHRLPGVVRDVGLGEGSRRKSQGDRQHDRGRQTGHGDKDGLDAARPSPTQTSGQARQSDRRQDADWNEQRVQQPPLDIGQVWQIEQRRHQRRPDQHERESLVAAAPGDGHADDGEKQREAEADGQAHRPGRLVPPLLRPLRDRRIAEEDPCVVGDQWQRGGECRGLGRERPPRWALPPEEQQRPVGDPDDGEHRDHLRMNGGERGQRRRRQRQRPPARRLHDREQAEQGDDDQGRRPGEMGDGEDRVPAAQLGKMQIERFDAAAKYHGVGGRLRQETGAGAEDDQDQPEVGALGRQ